jgi:phosphatidylinositol dimannoside acyltransferase
MTLPNRHDLRPAPLHYQAVAWRRLAYLGSRFGPRTWLKHSPGWFGVAFGVVLQHEREAVRRNLRRLFGVRSRWVEERDILRTFAAYAHCLAESLGSERADASAAQCAVSRREVLADLLRSGSGFVIGTAHTGGWDIAAQCLLKQSGRSVVLVMGREPDSRAQALQDTLRVKRGIDVIHAGDDALEGLALLRHLKSGGVVAVQLDRVPRGVRGVDVSLGRNPFRLPLGPFMLSSLAQVPLLPLFVARRGYYEYWIDVSSPVRLPPRVRLPELQAGAQQVARDLEAFLVANPEQWFNFGIRDFESPSSGAQ